MSGATNSNSLPEWQCDDCGDSFSAMTRDQLKDKVSQHLSDCEAPEMWECGQCGWQVSKNADHYGEAKGTHIQDCHCIEWWCPRCRQRFEASGEARLDELKQRHKRESECYSDPTYLPEKESIGRKEVPRNPSEYQPTDHFAVRKAKRKEPDVESEIIEKLISDGAIYTTHHRSRFYFERKINGWTWRLFVRLVDTAFVEESKKHMAITIYALESEQHEVAYDLGL